MFVQYVSLFLQETKLQKRKYRDEFNQYIVEGMHLVLEAFKSGVIEEVILLEDVKSVGKKGETVNADTLKNDLALSWQYTFGGKTYKIMFNSNHNIGDGLGFMIK